MSNTIWAYVDTSKQVRDVDHIKVFANAAAAEAWFAENDPEGVAFEYDLMTTAREAHDRFQQEVEHILKDLKRNP